MKHVTTHEVMLFCFSPYKTERIDQNFGVVQLYGFCLLQAKIHSLSPSRLIEQRFIHVNSSVFLPRILDIDW